MDEENKIPNDEVVTEKAEEPAAQDNAENGNPIPMMPAGKTFCAKCGNEILEGQEFCPKCGQKVGGKIAESVSPTGNSVKKIKKPVIGIIVAAVAVVVIIIAVMLVRGTQADSITLNKDEITVKVDESASLSFTIDPDDTKDKTVEWSSSNESIAKVDNGTITGVNEGDCIITVKTSNGKTDTCEITVTPAGPDLYAIYDEYCDSSYAEVASDGSYLSIDTNPSDIDDYTDYYAYEAIMEVNDALELPDSVLNSMNQTSSLDGIQTYSTDELEVSWKYHPDNGLEVNYTLK